MLTYLVRNIVENGGHAPHVNDGKDGVEKLALLSVVIPLRNRSRLSVSSVVRLSEGPARSAPNVESRPGPNSIWFDL